jgi:hypothetical protein
LFGYGSKIAVYNAKQIPPLLRRVRFMIALVDDWGNSSPTGAGTDWSGFAALFLKDSQIEQMRSLYVDVCKRLGRKYDTPMR